ncbi:MAG: YicC family protein [Alphaproteobacteria bacterium]|nr:YicC family protein [Alphaproteobacteria bacterium]
MTIASMTGFGHSDGEYEDFRWTWELRSVNGRGLDLRIRMPADLSSLENTIREKTGQKLKRGNIQISLQISRSGGATQIRINPGALQQVLAVLSEIEMQAGLAPSTADGILNIRGVVEQIEPEETEASREQRLAALLTSFDLALADLLNSRAAEGRRLHAIVSGQVTEIARLTAASAERAAGAVEMLQERLTQQLATLLENRASLSEERLAQEVALLAAKADIREEIDRLNAHVSSAQSLLKESAPVGRKLDFLIQEFNREANTLCSKSPDIALTRIGLDLKVQIEQLREQIQNIE